MPWERLRLFALSDSRPFGLRVARAMGLELSEHEEREFEDGEHKTRPLVSVRDCDAFVVQSLYGDEKRSVHDKLCRLLFFLATLRQASARRVTALVPYLCYGRKDRQTKARDPVTTRYLASLFESMGTDRLVAMDVHNPAAFQNAFRCAFEQLEAKSLLVDHFAACLDGTPLSVVSPDSGGTKRSEAFRKSIAARFGQEVSAAYVAKHRSSGQLSGDCLVGDVQGCDVVIVDDMISTGRTIARAVQACRRQGARRVFAAASHGLFIPPAEETLSAAQLDGLAVADTIPPFRLGTPARLSNLSLLDSAPLFAKAVERLHLGGSLLQLRED